MYDVKEWPTKSTELASLDYPGLHLYIYIRPDELHVRYEGGVLTIEGLHKERLQDGNGTVHRQFIRYLFFRDLRLENSEFFSKS